MFEAPMHAPAVTLASLVVVAAALVAAAPASASQVSAAGTSIMVVDSLSQTNGVDVNWGASGDLPPTVRDTAGATPVAPCAEEFVGIVCANGLRPVVLVRLGGGDDSARSLNLAAAGSHSEFFGEEGNDDLESQQGSDTLDGGPGADELTPDEESSSPGDVVRGGSGTDLLQMAGTFAPTVVATLDGRPDDGGPGERDNYASDIENVTGSSVARNTIVGTSATNLLEGRDLSDRLTGGGGRDELKGLGGSDTLNALDGARGDRVDCGSGADVAYADAGDVVSSECERRTFAPGLSSSRLRYRSGRVRVALTCPRASRSTCSGTVRLSSKGKTLAKASYRVRRGSKRTVTLKPRKRPARSFAGSLSIGPRGAGAPSGRRVTVRR